MADREWGEPPLAALPPQDRNGALTVVELNSPRVAPLHRLFKS
ncbi:MULTISPECIES: hypothetical protein [Moorena]|uniref:Uncharacterized protein n=1 Tax=Moorena producens (strain JHB) TaxID=1454205 RepID=A0A9Q9UWR7_MOOP1|nr:MULTISPECIES: hypothetical protein [Moorena]WAN70128.1 hypothetical protein BJP36_39430 [Moorena producens JHB]